MEIDNKFESLPATPETKKPIAKKKPVIKVESAEITEEIHVDPKEQAKRELKEKINKEREYKSRKVTGKFLFNECPGGELKFAYREFPGDQLTHYAMKHDTIHTIPLGVAQHLNDRCAYAEYAHNLDQGKAVNAEEMYIQSKVHRTSFIPLDFTADAGNFGGQSLVEVKYGKPTDNRYEMR